MRSCEERSLRRYSNGKEWPNQSIWYSSAFSNQRSVRDQGACSPERTHHGCREHQVLAVVRRAGTLGDFGPLRYDAARSAESPHDSDRELEAPLRQVEDRPLPFRPGGLPLMTRRNGGAGRHSGAPERRRCGDPHDDSGVHVNEQSVLAELLTSQPESAAAYGPRGRRLPPIDRTVGRVGGGSVHSVAREQGVHMSKRGQHVVPAGGGWAVRKAGARRASGRFATQKAAIDSARKLAKKQKTELYVHGRDGKIRERDSYGSDAHPPKG